MTCSQFIGTEAALYLSEVELEDVADVVRRVIRQLHQVLPVFECLAELLHARFGAVHTINSLRGPREETKKTNKQTNHEQFLVEVHLSDDKSSAQRGCAARAYLDVEGSALNLRRALLDDEWDAVWAVLRCLGKVNTKELQSALELFMAALDCERFQALLVAGQRALV